MHILRWGDEASPVVEIGICIQIRHDLTTAQTSRQVFKAPSFSSQPGSQCSGRFAFRSLFAEVDVFGGHRPLHKIDFTANPSIRTEVN